MHRLDGLLVRVCDRGRKYWRIHCVRNTTSRHISTTLETLVHCGGTRMTPSHPFQAPEMGQGLPPIVLGVLTLFLLPNRPESTSFFNERERKIALARMNRATRGDVGATVNKGLPTMVSRRMYISSSDFQLISSLRLQTGG